MHKNDVAVPDASGNKVVDFFSGTSRVVGSVERPETELEIHSPHRVEDFHVKMPPRRAKKPRLTNSQVLQNLIASLSLTHNVSRVVGV